MSLSSPIPTIVRLAVANATTTDPNRSSHYGLTDTVVRNSGIAANVFSSFSLAMTLGFLGGTIWIYSYPNCRHILDRVSFRLLTVAMFFEFWYSFTFLLLYINDTIYQPGGTLGPGHCTAGVYFLVSSMHVVDLLVMFIALNLFLTINMGINPLKLHLERWYIGISIAIGYIVPIPSAALQHFGWDRALGTCWINGRGRKTRVKYLIEGIYITPIITCFVSTVCVAVVLVVLFRQGRATSRALFGGAAGKQKIGDESGSISMDPLSSGTDPLDSPDTDTTLFEDPKETGHHKTPSQSNTKDLHNRMSNLLRGKGWTSIREKQEPQSYFHSLSDKFLSIAIKISWYPITLLFMNAIMMVGDLVIAAQGGVASHKTVWLYCIYYVVYGGRGICIAGLAIIIDPSLVRGLKAAWKERQLARNPDMLPTTQSSPLETTFNRTQYSTNFDHLATATGMGSQFAQTESIPARPRVDSEGSFDFATALAYIPDPTTTITQRERDDQKDTLPTVEVDLSYLDQELDTTILGGGDTTTTGTSEPPPPPPPIPTGCRSSTVRPFTGSSQKTTGRGILSRLPGPSTRSQGQGGHRELKPVDPEVERRKEEKRKREERVREIKRRFEEVQRQL
ncbi:hypothetical protein I302_108484 [Kwoniella bestiolae CBS 10118]|uniref:Uncharacterized protein n=1 Tax=Kwoniella bestiolae CBS 10118 TaxID=1296100 RepID=A0A1B9FVJ5_9TREE|nr:hypothetical protein I302_07140 [Kwoniella bestiolae CBS 10118]OCF22799.1 hypothetical protein I302_07140 [Kwoniella bestiolae CBS 10118]